MHGPTCIFRATVTPFSLQSFYDPPDVLGSYNFSEHLANKRAPDAMVIHLGSNDAGHGGNWTNPDGPLRARSHCRFVLPLIHSTPYSFFLKKYIYIRYLYF